MSTTTDELINLTGGCGLFQLVHVTSVDMSRVLVLWGLFMMSFGNFNPGLECRDKNTSLGINYIHTVLGNHSVAESWVYNNPINNTSTMNSSNCSNVEFIQNGKTIVTEWSLIGNKEWIASLITSSQMVGYMVGNIIAGYFAENQGRKRCLYTNVLLFTLANALAAFSNSWQMFTVMRFVIGISIGGMGPISYVLAIEFFNSKWRGIFGGLPIPGIGLFIFSIIVFLERDWRLIHITTAAVSFIILMTYFWVSESMRWLAVHGKIDEAKAVVCKIAKYNKTEVPKMDVIDAISKAECDSNNSSSKVYSYMDLFRERKLCIMTIKLVLLWFVQTIAFYIMAYSVGSLPGDFYINFIIFCASEIPAVSLTGLIANKIGRVKTGAIFYGIASLGCVCATIVSLSSINTKDHIAIVVLLIVAKGFATGGKAIMVLSTSELVPTNVRALNMSFCLLISRIGAILSPFLVPGELITLNTFLILLTTLLLLSTGIFLSLPETKDEALSDITIEMSQYDECSGMNNENGGLSPIIKEGQNVPVVSNDDGDGRHRHIEGRSSTSSGLNQHHSHNVDAIVQERNDEKAMLTPHDGSNKKYCQ